MTRSEAHALLDAAREGANVTQWQITQALAATGDLTPIWRNRMPIESFDFFSPETTHEPMQ